MKHFSRFFALAILIALSMSFNRNVADASAKNIDAFSSVDNASMKIIPDNHGGYFVEALEDSPLSPVTSTCSAATIKTKTKTLYYYNSNNILCWSYSLTASFKVKKGVSATYYSSSAQAKISNASWSVASEKHSGSGNTATGTITMKTSATALTRTATIKCDKNGNFS